MQSRERNVLMAGDAGSVHFHRWAGFVHAAGFPVDVLSYERPTKMDPTLDYKPHRLLRRSGSRCAKLVSVVLDLFTVNNPRYVIANFHYLTLRWALYVLARRGPSLITCWGSDILIHFRRARGLSRLILQKALRKAAAITCDSTEVKQVIVETIGAPQKIHLVLWGVNTGRFRVTPNTRTTARTRYGIPPDATVILSIRRATRHFQLEQVIDWFTSSIRDPGVILFMHLVSEFEPVYAEQCLRRASGVANILTNTRKLTADQIVDLYALSDIDVHNPVSDATPVSMLEGIACRNLQLCRAGIAAYRDMADTYTIEQFNSIADITEERIEHMMEEKEMVADRNLESLKHAHAERYTVCSLESILGTIAPRR